MTILDYVDRNAPLQSDEQSVEFATKEQLDSLNEQFAIMNEKLNDFGKFATKE